MSFDDNTDFDDANPPEESSNRTFLLAAGLLGGLVLLGLLCIAGYLFFRKFVCKIINREIFRMHMKCG